MTALNATGMSEVMNKFVTFLCDERGMTRNTYTATCKAAFNITNIRQCTVTKRFADVGQMFVSLIHVQHADDISDCYFTSSGTTCTCVESLYSWPRELVSVTSPMKAR